VSIPPPLDWVKFTADVERLIARQHSLLWVARKYQIDKSLLSRVMNGRPCTWANFLLLCHAFGLVPGDYRGSAGSRLQGTALNQGKKRRLRLA